VSQDIASITRQLQLLGNEAMRLAADFAAEACNEREVSSARDSDVWLRAAEDVYRERQRRREFFGDDLFGEPAWDMLLDLYIAERKSKRLSVTAACIGANCSGTTGLRRLQQLEERGLVARETDPTDARRSFVRLSERGYAAMTDYLWSTCGSTVRERGPSRGNDRHPAVPASPVSAHLIEAAATFTRDRRAA